MLPLTLDTINPNMRRLQYAVRGPIVVRANEIIEELKQGIEKPFPSVIRCNIGDCQACGQPPITFLRQVCALAVDPSLRESLKYPDDAKQRANRILNSLDGSSIGSYSHSCGIPLVRQDIARYIEKRDGVSSCPDDIFLSTGASGAIKSILALLSTTESGKNRSGIMIPIPQYPLYSAANAEYNAYEIGYYLDEDKNWAITEEELERAIKDSYSECVVRAIVVINPGNPTGQVFTGETIETILRFAKKYSLVVLADEVYQHNVYVDDQEFISFKKVLHHMGKGYAGQVPLASFMSASKGFMGECGFRCGYCELVNFKDDVKAELYKCLSSNLCPPVIGQLVMDVIVNPPKIGETSFEFFNDEKEKILADLKFKADLVSKTFNSMRGYSCNIVAGSMYAFPRLDLPTKAIEASEKLKLAPDFFYCKNLLESKGICVVPGSGFGQKQGVYHFRITILPTVEEMKVVMDRIRSFHDDFMLEYA